MVRVAYLLFKYFHGFSQNLIIKSFFLAEFRLEELGESHVQEGRTTQGARTGRSFLNLQRWFQSRNCVRDEIDRTATGIHNHDGIVYTETMRIHAV